VQLDFATIPSLKSPYANLTSRVQLLRMMADQAVGDTPAKSVFEQREQKGGENVGTRDAAAAPTTLR
jgi:hypothetical protein